jgi:hypothetical protein
MARLTDVLRDAIEDGLTTVTTNADDWEIRDFLDAVVDAIGDDDQPTCKGLAEYNVMVEADGSWTVTELDARGYELGTERTRITDDGEIAEDDRRSTRDIAERAARGETL